MALDASLEQRFSAVPVHSPQTYQRLSLDPRLAKKFLRSGTLLPEERQTLQTYIVQSKWIPTERAVYSAVVDQFSTVQEIETVTGLPKAEVEKVIGKLERKGVLRRVKSD